jgi:phage/plasmid primase-like uncharacterized protein
LKKDDNGYPPLSGIYSAPSLAAPFLGDKMNDILKFIDEHKLPPIDLGKASGQWHKLEDNNFKGSYIFSVTTYKDKAVTILTVYNFRSGEKFTGRFGAEQLTKGELKDVQSKIDLQTEELQKEKLRKQNECKDYASEEFGKINLPDNNSWTNEYLRRKGLSGLCQERNQKPNIRFRQNLLGGRDVIIPFYSADGTLWNYQSITEAGEKQVLTGGRLEGCFHPLFDTHSSFDVLTDNLVYVCEGFATALTVFLALDQKYTVVAAISATNIEHVVRSLHDRFDKLSYIICADDDCWRPNQENTGHRVASHVVSRVDGGAYGLPNFSGLDTTGKPTDFNDLLCLENLLAVALQIKEIKINRPTSIYSLGYNHKNYFFTTNKAPQIITLSEFTEPDMLKLASYHYWAEKYSNEKGQVNYTLAKDKLIRECQKQGIFENNKMRGLGYFHDSEKIIKHKGLSLNHLEKKSVKDISDVKSAFYYDPTTRIAAK